MSLHESDIDYECDFIDTETQSTGSDGSGSSKVDPPGVEYHVRITLKKNTTLSGTGWKKLIKEYNEYWNVTQYLWAFEYSDKGQPHLHGAIIMKQKYNSGTMSKFMAKYKSIMEGIPGYYHDIVKDKTKNLAYCAKENEIVSTNYTADEIHDIQQKITDIQNDMKCSATTKVLNHLKKYKKDYYHSFGQIKRMICELYVKEYDKLPPVNVKQMAIYCAIKLDLLDKQELEINI